MLIEIPTDLEHLSVDELTDTYNKLYRYKTEQSRSLIDKARTDRNTFVEYVLKDKDTKQNIIQGDIHRAIQFALENYKKVLIEISREHGKTTQILGGILYELGRNPDILIKIISASDDLAAKRVGSIKTHIESNRCYQEVFPDVKPFVNKFNIKDGWGNTRITLQRDVISPNPSLQASGIISSGVGDRADLIVFDDPCNLRNTILFPALRESVIQAYENVWTPLLSPTGRQWYLATPWHDQDLTTVLKERWKDDPNACVIEFHVGQEIEITSEGEVVDIEETGDKFLPIWNDRWHREALIERFGDIGARSYDRGYLCKVMSDDDIIFKEVWLEAAKNNSLSFNIGYGVPNYENA